MGGKRFGTDKAGEDKGYINIGKSHAFLQQLESILGQDYFKFAIRTIVKNHQHSTINSHQFKNVFLQYWDYQSPSK